VVPAFWFTFLLRKTTQSEPVQKKERWLVDVIDGYIGFVIFAGYMLGVVAWIWSTFFPWFPVGVPG
jgi:hypothetical protein